MARVPSFNAAPLPDPLVLLAGGPGQAASDLYLGIRGAFAPVRRDRDIIILDQRGTGRSNSLAWSALSASLAADGVPRWTVAHAVVRIRASATRDMVVPP